ncbi:TonB-dependent receptor plug domain-containing protein [Pseudoduganella namucuonensis]|uniref:Outer membrane receptor proteins, mostly Fe transport n=1 Tax=Pseudoduganella namucuonensis TaxID=1035707 RepID=A0A1I7G644_9BURK|nr:TonB-dependent receptor [Pseudoduganella namucuonensis]SFU43945.1 Outer membrane receptor proteins, mostly Fe transport [Pseudoduganella namucuonensis]
MKTTLIPLACALCRAAHAADGPDMPRVEIAGPGALAMRANDTAGKIVVGRDELLRYGDGALSGALKRQPGLTVSGGELRMRGLGAGYTQILVNGDPAPPGFSIDALAPELVERIEIMRSASAEFSAQAIAGSVNVILRKGVVRDRQRDLKLGLERDQGHWNPSATLQAGGRDGGRSYTVAATLGSSGYDGAQRVTESLSDAGGEVRTLRVFRERYGARIHKAGLAPRLNWTLEGGGTVTWQSLLDLTRATNHGESHESTLLGGATRSPESRWRSSTGNDALRSDLAWTRALAGDGKLAAKAGVNASRRRVAYLFTGADHAGAPTLLRAVRSSASDDGATSGGKYSAPLWPGHNLAAGWDGSYTRRRETRSQRDSAPSAEAAPPLDQDYTADVKRLALYAQDEWDVAPRLQAYLGLRWEGLDTATTGRAMARAGNRSSVWSPVAQVLWKLPERHQLRVALSRTYKAPLTRNLVPRRYTANNGNGPTNPDVQGNPGLRPELAWGVDAGYERHIGESGMVGVSAYARRIADVTVQRLFEERGVWVGTLANEGRASARGIEFDARLPLGALHAKAPAIDLRLNAARHWSRVDHVPGPRNRLAEQTPYSVNAGLDYRAAQWSAGWNFNLQGGGQARLTPFLVSDSGPARMLDAYALWKLPRRGQLRLGIANALKQDRPSSLRHASHEGITARDTLAPSTTALRLHYEQPFQ